MMSPEDRLVYMANQIARNLAAQGEDAAVLAVADHIAAFWDPRMKAKLLGMAETGLDLVAARAVERLRTAGSPAPQSAATSFAGGSDAG